MMNTVETDKILDSLEQAFDEAIGALDSNAVFQISSRAARILAKVSEKFYQALLDDRKKHLT